MHKQRVALTALAIATAAIATAASARSEKVDVTVIPSGNSVAIATRAAEVAPHVFDLGQAIDPHSGKPVQGYAIVHYKNDGGNARGSGGTGSGGDPTASCYSFISSGAKWKTVEPWIVNPSNAEGLDDQYVFDTLNNAISTWEDAADGTQNGVGFNILGNGSLTNVFLNPNATAPNGSNEVIFGTIEDSGAIAVTIAWGTWGGRPSSRQIVEWDQIYDQADFDWSATSEPIKMNFANIGIHEIGHSFGLGDLYQTECAQQTMYGYGVEGETKKWTLEAGDIAGISKLY